MNGYTTIGITPELLDMMGDDWSEPVQVRARRRSNGALDLEFRRPFAAAPDADPAKPKGRSRATDQ